MKVISLKVMRGPNYWSVDTRKLIVLELDLQEFKSKKINDLKHFQEEFDFIFDRFYKEETSAVGTRISSRIAKGTTIAQLIAEVALELQSFAGYECAFTTTKEGINPGEVTIVFEYKDDEAARHAAYAALDLVEALFLGEHFPIESDVARIREIAIDNYIGLSTGSLVNEGLSRGIPYMDIDDYIILGYGKNQKRIQATLSGCTSFLGVNIAGDKDGTKNLLKKFSVPIPEGILIEDEVELEAAIETVGLPLVIKPLDGNHGRGISVNISNLESAITAFNIAKKISRTVIVERYVIGFDYRLIVINYKFIGALKRVAAYVTGDGKSTIRQLIETINSEPRRQNKIGNILKKITIDEATLSILKRNELTLDSVLEDGRILYVKDTANVSTAGVPIDETDTMHPYNIFQAERIARIVGLDICGIDVISPDLSVPMTSNGAAIVEVNAAPGIRMHMEPAEGKPRDVSKAIIDMLFPEGSNPLIPIVAVTGTNGKTTTTRLIAHIAGKTGLTTGYTTTDGIYINNILMEKGDCSGPISARYVLRDPMVDFAVLECARGGILRSGLGFDKCDIGIVTNITGDHLGLNNINSLQELTQVKAVVPKSVKEDGYAVLNADDPNVLGIAKELKCKIALFSTSSKNKAVAKHIDNGGTAATVEDGLIVVYHEGKRTEIEKVDNVPLTIMGKASFMLQNILPAVITCVINNFKLKDIKLGLKSFIPSPEHTPGRLNIFNFKDFEVVVDYAHNPAGIEALGDFLKSVKATQKIGVIAAVGDRRDEDIIRLGEIAGEVFDEIILRRHKNLRGRNEDELFKLLAKGIAKTDPDIPVQVIPDEVKAVDYALEHVKKGGLVTVLADSVSDTIALIKRHKEEEMMADKAAVDKRL